MPEGLQGNPEATPKCKPATFIYTLNCPSDSRVGTIDAVVKAPYGGQLSSFEEPIFNLVPPPGTIARFGMVIATVPAILDMRVSSDGSYRIVSETARVSQMLQLISADAEIWGVPGARSGSGSVRVPLLTMGAQCGRELSATIRLNSWQQPDRWLERVTTQPALTGCERLQLKPSMDVRPLSDAPDVPSGYRFKMNIPQSQAPNGLGTPPLKRAEILFPEGTAISPGGANGLVGCSDAQAALGVDASPSCPSASRIGSVRSANPATSAHRGRHRPSAGPRAPGCLPWSRGPGSR